MAKLETFGSKKWWPLRVLERQTEKGRETKEIFRNMVTGETCCPKDKDGEEIGWNGAPPNDESGKKDSPVSNSQKYSEGYDKIKWDKEKA